MFPWLSCSLPDARSGVGRSCQPSTSTHRVPEGIASSLFHNQHFAMPVTPNRTVSFVDNVEIYEVPTEHDCNLNPCHAKHRTHNPVRITKGDRTRKDTIEARPYLQH